MLFLLTTSITRAHAFTNGQSASLVIGQKDSNSSYSATSRNGLYPPFGKTFDSSANLWVPDLFDSRILHFSSTVVPEFPTASLAIIAVISLAVVAVVSGGFSLRKLAGKTQRTSGDLPEHYLS
jgi:hypothetical protein